MQAKFIKGNNSSYFFFPQEQSTILSKSNYSVVYIAADADTKEKVICKQFLPAMFHNQTAQLQFSLETNIRLQHPGLAKILDIIVEEANIFIIQEFVYGLSLKELIYSREYFDYRYNYFFYKVIAKFLETLSFFHQQSLCLGDIKPSNIMVCSSEEFGLEMKNPEIKIIDIGLVKPSFKPAIPCIGGKSFNLKYASPEQILGFSELVGDHSDIFSTGLILYEAIAKEPALNTTNPMFVKRLQTRAKIEKHFRFDDGLYNVISYACVKPEFARINTEQNDEDVKMAIIKALNKRFQTAESFRSELLKLII